MTNRHLPYYGTKTNGTAGQPLPITPMEWLANWELNGRRTALSAVNQPGEVPGRPHPQTFALSTDAKRNSRQTMNPEGETFLTKLKKPAGAYLIGTAVIVAAFFITNPLLAGLLDPVKVWAVLDILMLIGLLTALAFNYAGKRTLAEGQEPDDSVSRRNLEINIAFYLTAGVTILFLHNWFSLLAQGTESLAGNHQAWVIWAAVDTMLPLVLGTTGCRIMKEKS